MSFKKPAKTNEKKRLIEFFLKINSSADFRKLSQKHHLEIHFDEGNG